MDILVENDRSDTVEITGMRSVVHQRSAAFAGSLVLPSGGGPPLDMVRLAFDLDRDEAPAMSVDKSLRVTDVAAFDGRYFSSLRGKADVPPDRQYEDGRMPLDGHHRFRRRRAPEGQHDGG